MRHQVAVHLEQPDFDRLRRLSVSDKSSYAETIAASLRNFESPDPSLVKTRMAVYALLPPETRAIWQQRARELRALGKGCGGIAQQLFAEGLCDLYGRPVHTSTVRHIVAPPRPEKS